MVERRKREEAEVVLQGVGVSPGVAMGPAFLVSGEEEVFVESDLGAGEVAAEIGRFEDAVIQTRRQIKLMQDNLGRSIGQNDASIFNVHLMVLDDRALVDEIIKDIEQKRKNAEFIVKSVTHRYADALSKVEDDYLRERVIDVKDVARRILQNLSGKHGSMLEDLKDRSIIVASNLAPSDTVLRKDLVRGIATDLGSAISHTAIMARALRIPAAVGLGDVTTRVSSGDNVLIDGSKGLLIIHPTTERMEAYGKLIEARRSIQSSLINLRDQPAETKDGCRIALSANIEMVEEVEEVKKHGAQSVGLFRSEYLYLSAKRTPTEDEQADAYGKVARLLAPATVIIRTVDLGGDKFASHMTMPPEVNPFMGFRAIRFCLAQPDLFKVQLRAILRASAHRNVKLMYPMISSVEEVIRANELLHQAMDELRARKAEFDPEIEVGVMIEIPSAALTADMIAPHVKFFSLGTNDLVQYTLAVDRVNDRVAHLYEPTHPAVLRLIDNTIRVGHEHGLWVGVCGEMAGDPVLAPLLFGLGADELSMAPASVPIVKDSIRSITYTQAKELAEAAMAAGSAGGVLGRCRELTRQAAPEILELVG